MAKPVSPASTSQQVWEGIIVGTLMWALATMTRRPPNQGAWIGFSNTRPMMPATTPAAQKRFVRRGGRGTAFLL